MPALDPNWYCYLEVACPQCQAKPGAYCKRPSGHSGPLVAAHKERKAAAHIVWRAEEVQRYGKQVTSWDDDPVPLESAPKPTVRKVGKVPAPVVVSRQYKLFS